MTTEHEVIETNYEDIRDSWLESVKEGTQDTIELGNRFAIQIFREWLGLSEDDLADIFHCDGPGDGGIDIASLVAADEDADKDQGSVWYIVQSKYREGNESIDYSEVRNELTKMTGTLRRLTRSKLNEETERFLNKFDNFIANKSDKDKIIFVYAISIDPSKEDFENLQHIFDDIIKLTRESIHSNVEIKLISPRTILSSSGNNISLAIEGDFSENENMVFERISLDNLYNFMQEYRSLQLSLIHI